MGAGSRIELVPTQEPLRPGQRPGDAAIDTTGHGRQALGDDAARRQIGTAYPAQGAGDAAQVGGVGNGVVGADRLLVLRLQLLELLKTLLQRPHSLQGARQVALGVIDDRLRHDRA
jgi:hypothetical protein